MMEKFSLFLELGEVAKDAVSHSNPKGTKVKKRKLVLQHLDPAQNFPRLATAGSPLYFWISQYFHGEQGLRQNAEVWLLSSSALF